MENPYQEIDFQGGYAKELIAATDYPDLDLEAASKTFYEWGHQKEEDTMGFRDTSYRSTLTGTMSPPHHTNWIEAMDDFLEGYLKTDA